MPLLSYARKRISSVLDEITELEGCEFPYPHSRDALVEIKKLFRYSLWRLEKIDDKTNPEVLAKSCALSLKTLFRCLPLLGFIVRSTTVRNSFEVFRPILDISRMALEPKVGKEAAKQKKLVLSSEWRYSPLTYHEIPDLPGFIFIGLPATESDNPLLIPLSGHELGHSIWTTYKLAEKVKAEFKAGVIDYICKNWKQYQSLFPNVQQADLQSGLFALETWEHALSWSLNQAKETFCDLVGLRIFGTAFLQAFAYLFAPNVASPRSARYPDPLKRVQHLLKAAREKTYNYDIPSDYEDMFCERPTPALAPGERFQLKIADFVLASKVDMLIEEADNIVSKTDIPKPCETESERIRKRFEFVVPAQKARSLVDIVNAAWKAYNDQNLWKSMPKIAEEKTRILADLVLKNIEIFAYERVLEGTS